MFWLMSISNLALNYSNFTWCNEVIQDIRAVVADDNVGRPKYRFC